MQKPYKIIANWKTFGTIYDVDQFLNNIVIPNNNKIEIIFSVPFVFLYLFQNFIKNHKNCSLAVQNISYDMELQNSTGEINFNNLKDFKIKYCILGHSERKRFENYDLILKKIEYTIKSNVVPIVCIEDELESQNYQISNIAKILKKKDNFDLFIAYEPTSSIGTGIAQSNEMINDTILRLKNELNHGNIEFFYGGSVNEENINLIVRNKEINGVLVGKKSWHYSTFNQIISTINERFI